MNKYELFFEKVQEMYESGEIDLKLAEKLNDMAYEKYVNESVEEEVQQLIVETATSNRFKKEIKEIKDAKPGEFTDDDKTKEFIDKHYDKITEISKYLEKEPEKLRKEDIKLAVKYVIGVLGGYALFVAGITSGAFVVGIVAYIMFGVVLPMIGIIVNYCRRSDDISILRDLSKIKSALEKIKNNNHLSKSQKAKVGDMIDKINDAEIEGYEKLKVQK